MNRYILAAFTLLLSFTSVIATHSVGSEWKYRCLNANGDYEITLYLFRDCSGIPMCAGSCGSACNVEVTMSGASNSCNGTNFGRRTLQLVSVRDEAYDSRCVNAKSICTNMGCTQPGTFTPGVERYEFRAIINLSTSSGVPTNCCMIRFSYSLCCRNGQISTGAANSNFYTDILIDRCVSTPSLNGSPEITRSIPHVLCAGQPATIVSGMVDPDLDSLSYAFVPSLAGQGGSVAYTPPFSYDRPMPWVGPSSGSGTNGIHIDPLTGDIRFTPAASSNFIGALAVGIKEWKYNSQQKTYKLAGETRRDMLIWLRQCPVNEPPSISSNPPLYAGTNTLRNDWLFYSGKENCFELSALDTNIADTTFLSWNAAMAKYGATFIPNYVPAERRTNGPREDKYRFCWTPHDSVIRSMPYVFTVKAEDTNCPLPGNRNASFSIYVRNAPNYSNPSKVNTVCNQYNFSANIAPEPGWFNYVLWEVTRTPNDREFAGPTTLYQNNGNLNGVQFLLPGRYYIKYSATIFYHNNLNNTITVLDSIDITSNSFGFEIDDTAFCNNSSLTLKPVIYNPASDALTYRWFRLANPSNILSDSDTLEVANTNKTEYYVLHINNNSGCSLFDTIEVSALPPKNSPFIYGPSSVLIDRNYEYNVIQTAGANYQWQVQNGTILSGQGTYKVTVAWHNEGSGKLSCNEIINSCMHDTINLTVQVNIPATINEVRKDDKLIIYPNPVTDILYLQLADEMPKGVEIIDISGKTISVSFLQVAPNKISVNTAILPAGLYSATVKLDNGSIQVLRFNKTDR